MALEIKKANLKWKYSLTPFKHPIAKIVVHHAAGNGSVEDIHKYHQSLGWNGIGYHYYVRKDGTVWEGRPVGFIGGHTTGHNYNSIGVCFEGNFEIDDMLDEQFDAGYWLLDLLKEKFPKAEFVRHNQLQSTACPGDKFPFEEMVFDRYKIEDVNTPEPVDEAPADWAAEAVNWAKMAGLYKGDGTFRENFKEPFSKERVLVLFHRFYKEFIDSSLKE